MCHIVRCVYGICCMRLLIWVLSHVWVAVCERMCTHVEGRGRRQTTHHIYLFEAKLFIYLFKLFIYVLGLSLNLKLIYWARLAGMNFRDFPVSTAPFLVFALQARVIVPSFLLGFWGSELRFSHF